MNKELFFNVWNVYQNHWGRDTQEYYKKHNSAHLLWMYFQNSANIKAFYRLANIFRSTCNTSNMESLLKETFEHIKNISEACLREEQDSDNFRLIEPIQRMRYNIHLPIRSYCRDTYQREWCHLQNHIAIHKHGDGRNSLFFQYSGYLSAWKLSYSIDMDDSIYRVSSIVALF